jgi:hypothetical protein
MVVAAALVVAVLPVIADVAMSDWVGISRRRRNLRDLTEAKRADQPNPVTT